MQVKTISVKQGRYYNDGIVQGDTVAVIMQRGEEFVGCNEILYWEESEAEDMFDEWVACALNGEEGYEYWTA